MEQCQWHCDQNTSPGYVILNDLISLEAVEISLETVEAVWRQRLTGVWRQWRQSGDRDLLEAVVKGKNNKAVGLDNIANELLKNEAVVKLLHCLFCTCFELCMIPNVWHKAVIHLIPKEKKDLIDPLQYQGLALQSCIFKIFCYILNSRVVKFADDKEIMADEQNGFRRHRSCQHHIFSLVTMIRNHCEIKNGGQLFTCFVDFKKVFDAMDRDLLIHRLGEMGINGPFLEVTKQIYSHTGSYIHLNGMCSKEFESKNGLLQGNNLSPMYFALYINDLLEELRKSNLGAQITPMLNVSTLAYADDIVLISLTADGLQRLLDIVMTWCHNWRVLINVAKTKVVHFQRKGTTRTSRVFTLGDHLEITSEYKYLDTMLNEHMNIEKMSEILADVGSRALGGVLSMIKNNYDLGYFSYTKMYNSGMVPILEYVTGAWCCGNVLSKVDVVQNCVIRFCCGLPQTAPILGMIRDMGWIPCMVRRDLETLRLFNQIVSMPTNRLTRLIFEWDMAQGGEWSQNAKQLLSSIDIEDYWVEKAPVNIEVVQSKLLEMFESTWRREVCEKPKLRTYVKVKESFGVEAHITANLIKISMR